MFVYGNYTQEELDRQYDQRSLVPDSARYTDRWRDIGARVRAELPCRLGIPYGGTEDETLDVFPAGSRAPLLLYLHGGAWTRRSKEDASYIAPSMVASGITFIGVDFTLAPRASLDEMARQCRAAVAWVYRNARQFDADPERLFVLGHSSGAHLAGLVLVTDWEAAHGLPRNTLKGVAAFSGMYDLEPVRLSHRNQYLRLDPSSARRNSPIHHIPENGPPLVVGYGDGELQEFQRQSHAFADAWRAKGNRCTELVLEGRNHFAVGDDLAEPASPAFMAIMDQMGIR